MSILLSPTRPAHRDPRDIEDERRDAEVAAADGLMRDDFWRDVDAETAEALTWTVSRNNHAPLDSPDHAIDAGLTIEVDAFGETTIEALQEAESKVHRVAAMLRRRIDEAVDRETERLRKQHEQTMRRVRGIRD